MKQLLPLKAGFTIVELIIVVVVIAILVTLVAVGYGAVTKTAIETSMKSDLDHVASSLAFEYKKSGAYPNSIAAVDNGAGVSVSGQSSLNYQLKPYGYCVVITNPKTTKVYRIKSVNPSQFEEANCDTTVTTLAGSGMGFADGTGSAAMFNYPYGIAVDSGGTIYVADSSNQRIRSISMSGVVATYAGSGTYGYVEGAKANAQFKYPYDVAVFNGVAYISDNSNARIRQISAAGVVSSLAGSGAASFADGTGSAASFNAPTGIGVANDGSIYVADANNNRIRKISPTGVVTTLAGSGTAGYADGTGAAARLNSPRNVAIGSDMSVYVADMANNRIRKISPTGVVTTLAGSGTAGYADGTGAAAQFNNPYGVAVDSAGFVYVSDTNNHRVRQISPTGVVTTLAGSGTSGNLDGVGTSARFASPQDIAVDGSGNVYVAEYHRVRKISQ